MAFLCVFGGLLQGSLSQPRRSSSDERTSNVKRFHRDCTSATRFADQLTFESLSRRAKNIFGRDHDILKGNLTSVRAPLAHVDFFFPDNDSWSICVHHEPRHALGRRCSRISDGEHKVPVGFATICSGISSERRSQTHIHILLPFRIQLSPFFSAFVLMLATSDPAPGSVYVISDRLRFQHTTQYAAMRGSSVIRPRYFSLISCEAATMSGASASPFATISDLSPHHAHLPWPFVCHYTHTPAIPI